MSVDTDIFYQHLSATINRVWLFYKHSIKTTPCRNPATTSQTTPVILVINFQYNSTPTTSHISTNPSNIQYHCTTHISLIHITNFHTPSTTTPKYTLPQRLVGWGFSDIRNSQVLRKVTVRGYHASHAKQLFVTYPAAVLGPVSSFPLRSLHFDGATSVVHRGSSGSSGCHGYLSGVAPNF